VYGPPVRIWRTAETWHHIAWRYAVFGLLLGILLCALYRVRLAEVPDPMLALLSAILAAGLGLLVRRLLGGRVSGRFVAVTPNGILLGTAVRPEFIPWSDVERVVEHRGVLRLQCSTSAVPHPLEDIFADTAQRTEFAAVVQAALRARRIPPAATSNPPARQNSRRAGE
jgi:hypothetical protein